jgi:hypothetical protein
MKPWKIFILSAMMFLLVSTVGMADINVSAVEDVYMNPENLVRSFFVPEAVFGVRKSRTLMEVLDLDGFVDWWLEDIEKHSLKERGLKESVEKMKMTVYGNIAHCFVVYKVRLLTPADAPGQLGLDNFGLMKKEDRWWIVSITNDIITPQNPLPEDLR